MIPNFNENGVLPQGIYVTDFVTFSLRFGFSQRRKDLLQGLSSAISILKAAGCSTIYIDGSFVTDKELPNDIDCCWEGDFNIIGNNLLQLEPVLLDLTDGRRKQKEKFKCEFFNSEMILIDQYSRYSRAIDFFQQIRFSNEKKGIICINI